MKKRWICLFVENDVGVLARIAGLFSAKSYNLTSLTVGVTEDKTISRMTIGLTSDDKTFEQVKKQLNRCIEVIKVVDLTEAPARFRELMFVKITSCTEQEMSAVFRIARVFRTKIVDYDRKSAILECLNPESQNDEFLKMLQNHFPGKIKAVRGGSVGIECL